MLFQFANNFLLHNAYTTSISNIEIHVSKNDKYLMIISDNCNQLHIPTAVFDFTHSATASLENKSPHTNEIVITHNCFTLCFKKKFTLLLFAITKSDVDRFQ